ncbi:MAG: SAM-dependent methyltransferase [Chloroflexi bacterium]|nr:SAM-dependent methyltransferase [Chloroflexota bacterium]
MSNTTYELRPIGTVRASKGTFRLEIEAPFRPALKELGQFSHVMIFWWAHEVDTDEYRAITQADLPYAPGVNAGIFACRSQARPNPIGLTTMAILNVDEEAGIVELPWIDAIDGTPILDLKPYIPMADRIRDVQQAEWLKDWPMWMEDAAAFFAEHDVDVS